MARHVVRERHATVGELDATGDREQREVGQCHRFLQRDRRQAETRHSRQPRPAGNEQMEKVDRLAPDADVVEAAG
jgi:hypothetical protein